MLNKMSVVMECLLILHTQHTPLLRRCLDQDLVYLCHHSVGCVLGSAKDLSVGFIVLPAPATRIPPPVTTLSGYVGLLRSLYLRWYGYRSDKGFPYH
jgi:hypothetical protein